MVCGAGPSHTSFLFSRWFFLRVRVSCCLYVGLWSCRLRSGTIYSSLHFSHCLLRSGANNSSLQLNYLGSKLLRHLHVHLAPDVDKMLQTIHIVLGDKLADWFAMSHRAHPELRNARQFRFVKWFPAIILPRRPSQLALLQFRYRLRERLRGGGPSLLDFVIAFTSQHRAPFIKQWLHHFSVFSLECCTLGGVSRTNFYIVVV
mmetsp:Transcript_47887/g.93552  ORF Transcript_47887/g.93552 Transcript_47887/m.93552 type:complete len:203 (+) Transcript_47887:1045-1653(+)